jgi:HEPN domain-containing protein
MTTNRKKVYSFQVAPYRNFYEASESEKFALHSVTYLEASQKLYTIENRFIEWWIPAYYLIYHAMELAFKALLLENKKEFLKKHSLKKLYLVDTELFCFSKEELTTIEQITNLNYGKGQLRYPNEPKGEFYPNTWVECKNILTKIYIKMDSTESHQ